MNSAQKVTLPLTENDARKLKAGDRLLLNGVIWTARDAAHIGIVGAHNNAVYNGVAVKQVSK